MIRITVYQDSEGRCSGFDSCGHAQYADPGFDIICAGVSALIISTVNAVEQLTGDSFENSADESEGSIRFRFLTFGHDSQLLIQAMLLGLSEMENSYSQYIDLIYEEVQET